MDECTQKKVWSLKTVHAGIYENGTSCPRAEGLTSKLSKTRA